MTKPEREPILVETGARIRKARLEAGLNLQDFARLTGLSISALSLIETGKRDLRLTTLDTISSALRVSLADLFGGKRSDRDAAAGAGADTGRDAEPGDGARGYDLEEYT